MMNEDEAVAFVASQPIGTFYICSTWSVENGQLPSVTLLKTEPKIWRAIHSHKYGVTYDDYIVAREIREDYSLEKYGFVMTWAFS